MSGTPQSATLSVALITFNEEENIGRTLASMKDIADEIIVVDSGSTDRTVEIAKQFGAKVFVEEWQGFAAQKNSALDKCTCDWILSLDADEEVTAGLAAAIQRILISLNEWVQAGKPAPGSRDHAGRQWNVTHVFFEMPRRNLFLGRWIRRGGFYPDRKLRLVPRGYARFNGNARVHEDLHWTVPNAADYDYALLKGDLVHHQYPTLTSYIDHMNRYSSLGAEMVLDKRGGDKRGRVGFSIINIVVRPIATFIYNYFFRLGFLDGKEGLLLHLYHSVYVSWKYAKAWELSRQRSAISRR
jgi:glycosyltransferase involved in cell wall biosynthesis